jgi:hypothetical protein
VTESLARQPGLVHATTRRLNLATHFTRKKEQCSQTSRLFSPLHLAPHLVIPLTLCYYFEIARRMCHVVPDRWSVASPVRRSQTEWPPHPSMARYISHFSSSSSSRCADRPTTSLAFSRDYYYHYLSLSRPD